jgi:uncharacterized repeat protein (TIGR01451 family)/LPXTG-motif cell wall-anchored protein
MELAKVAASAPPTAGNTTTFVLTATNHGPSDAAAVAITDTLPSELTYVSSTPGGCTVSGQTVTCAPGLVASGASVTYTVTVRVDAAVTPGSAIANTANVTSTTPDPATGNNTSTARWPDSTGLADLSLAKKAQLPAGQHDIRPGGTFQYAVTVHNAGPSDAARTTVTDPLPASLAFVSSADGCTARGRTVTCGPVDIPAGSTRTWRFTVRLDAAYTGDGSDIDNRANVTSAAPDPNPSNNSNPSGSAKFGVLPPASKPSSPQPPKSQLPKTGTDTSALELVFGLLLAGGLLVVAGNRRRSRRRSRRNVR